MYVNRITLKGDLGAIEVDTDDPFDQSYDRECILYDNLRKKFIRFKTSDILSVKTTKKK